MSYTLDPKSAAKAGISTRIEETGAYKGHIVAAWEVVSTQGTDGVEMMFKTDDGLTSDYLQVWTTKKDGTELSGMNIIHAMMACCELRNLTTQKAEITRGNETFVVTALKEFTGKRVGLFLEKEPYKRQDNSLGFSMQIVAPFEADSRRTAREKLDRKDKPLDFDRIVARLKDRPLKLPRGQQAPTGSLGGAPQGQQSSLPDDDIPF